MLAKNEHRGLINDKIREILGKATEFAVSITADGDVQVTFANIDDNDAVFLVNALHQILEFNHLDIVGAGGKSVYEEETAESIGSLFDAFPEENVLLAGVLPYEVSR